MKYELETSDPEKRCHAVHTNGEQCNRQQYAEGCTCCVEHGGPAQLRKIEQQRVSMYKIKEFQNRIGELITDKRAKSARDEVALLRMTLEESINKMEKYGVTSLLAMAPQITAMSMAIGKLLETSQRLEMNAEAHIGKSEILNLATGMVQIISKYVEDTDILKAINDEISKLIEVVFNPDSEEDADGE